jgi:hypothetical protein
MEIVLFNPRATMSNYVGECDACDHALYECKRCRCESYCPQCKRCEHEGCGAEIIRFADYLPRQQSAPRKPRWSDLPADRWAEINERMSEALCVWTLADANGDQDMLLGQIHDTYAEVAEEACDIIREAMAHAL